MDSYCGQLGLGNACTDSIESAECAPLALEGFDTISDDDVDSDSDTDMPFEDAWGQMVGLQQVALTMEYESEDSDSMDLPLDELDSQYFYQRLEYVKRPKVNQFFEDLEVTFSSVHCGAYHSLCMSTCTYLCITTGQRK